MPIERDGKHWCDPASETPDENGLWSCTCGNVWSYDPEERLWSLHGEPDGGEYFTTAGAAAAPEAEPFPLPSPASTKRQARVGKGKAE